MSFRFQTFRRMVLAAQAVVALTSIILSIYVHSYFRYQSNVAVLVAIEGTLFVWLLQAILHKILFKSSPSVFAESMGLFVLLPFSLLLAVFVLAVPFRLATPKLVLSVYGTLRILIFINAIIHLSYTAGLFLTSVLTSFAFDSAVWSRDLDASPSPFPMTLLFSYAFPCISRPNLESQPAQQHPVICLPGCDCPSKQHAAVLLSVSPEMTDRILTSSTAGYSLHAVEQTRSRLSLPRTGSSISLSRSLVRLPNDAERRSAIRVAFEAV